MEGEKEFSLEIDIPMNVADEFRAIFTGHEIEDRKIVRNLFDELLSLDRAACMIEIHAPIELVHKGEYYLRSHGYHVFSSIILGLDFKAGFESQTPGDPEPMTSMYISLHPGFLEVAELIQAGVCGDALSGLIFGYSVKNIIGYFDQPGPTPEEEKEYLESLPP